jgi:hypothetical protein
VRLNFNSEDVVGRRNGEVWGTWKDSSIANNLVASYSHSRHFRILIQFQPGKRALAQQITRQRVVEGFSSENKGKFVIEFVGRIGYDVKLEFEKSVLMLHGSFSRKSLNFYWKTHAANDVSNFFHGKREGFKPHRTWTWKRDHQTSTHLHHWASIRLSKTASICLTVKHNRIEKVFPIEMKMMESSDEICRQIKMLSPTLKTGKHRKLLQLKLNFVS